MNLKPYYEKLARLETCRCTGSVTELVGLLVESKGPEAAVGDFCEIGTRSGRVIRTQVIGFREGRVLSMPLEETDGLHLGDPIVGAQGRRQDGGRSATAGPGAGWIRKAPGWSGPARRRVCRTISTPPPPGPLDREPIGEALVTGIRAIDSLLTCGKGQRIGIFGGSGVGKSTLLGAMARSSSADVSVIALIGERNREVRDFIEHELGPEGLKKSVLVVATSDRPAPLRIRAAFVALAVAEYFRDQGKDVLLVMDSVTRLAMAQREIGLAAGEPPSQKGYTPSVFHLLPKIFERAGRFRKGSITGFFTVLVEGDDFNEPICDAVRAILDGHIVLVARARRGGTLSGHRCAAVGQPAGAALVHAGTKRGGGQDSRSHGHAPALGRPDQSGRLCQRSESQAGRGHPLAAALLDFLKQDSEEKLRSRKPWRSCSELAKLAAMNEAVSLSTGTRPLLARRASRARRTEAGTVARALAALQEAKTEWSKPSAHRANGTCSGSHRWRAQSLQSLDAYRLHSRSQVRDIENRERQAEEHLEQQRQRVIEARRDAELLERLKRKALDAWQAASDREQETLATELYLAKRVRER